MPVYRAYHGTSARFEALRPSTHGAQGPGIYLTDCPNDYGTREMEVLVRLDNPYWFRTSAEALDAPVNGELLVQVLGPERAAAVVERMDRLGEQAYGMELQDELRRRGHDGIVMECPFGENVLPGARGSCILIAWDAEQTEIVSVREREAQEDEAVESRSAERCT